MEVMVAAVILTIAGLGTLTGLLQARKMTEGSIMMATATNIAQGYVEQLKSIDFSMLDQTTITELISQGVADSLNVSPMVSDPESGNDQTDVVNTRAIDINNTPEKDTDDLLINLVLYISDITDSGSGIGDAREIILRWSYVDNTNGAAVPVESTVFAIRSKIPTF
ncbi:hypothetical protein H5P27_01180 [Pelagicoccus albus]|uniref:Type IV pilus assembly protein PilV n=2 Tax=Pelagicoccus albus TaxID=415222 RepID=A0A7X1B3D6_9BACT|nr:hypothetical protein [Pelagicoccus albus]MBC2604659.1 hypothetical protein [Pelagicoccus albus]